LHVAEALEERGYSASVFLRRRVSQRDSGDGVA